MAVVGHRNVGRVRVVDVRVEACLDSSIRNLRNGGRYRLSSHVVYRRCGRSGVADVRALLLVPVLQHTLHNGEDGVQTALVSWGVEQLDVEHVFDMLWPMRGHPSRAERVLFAGVADIGREGRQIVVADHAHLNKVCGQMPHVGAPQCRDPVKVLCGEALVVAGDDLPHVISGIPQEAVPAGGASLFRVGVDADLHGEWKLGVEHKIQFFVELVGRIRDGGPMEGCGENSRIGDRALLVREEKMVGAGPELNFVGLVGRPEVGTLAIVAVKSGPRRDLQGLSNAAAGDGWCLHRLVLRPGP